MTSEDLKRKLREVGGGFLSALEEEVDVCVLLGDVKRLRRLVSAVHNHLDAEVVRGIRAKGFDKELRDICNRMGGEQGRLEDER